MPVRQRQEVQEVLWRLNRGPAKAATRVYFPRMAEKIEKQTTSLAEYRELMAVFREKFTWARDYL